VSDLFSGIAGMAGVIGDSAIAGQNLQFQQQNLQYNKDLQQQIFSREDSAIQRRVADLKAAGLNPILAAGSGAHAGAVVRTDAPQNQMKFDPSAIMSMLSATAQIAQTKAQTDYIKQQTAKSLAETSALQQLTPGRVTQLDLANQMAESANPERLAQIKAQTQSINQDVLLKRLQQTSKALGIDQQTVDLARSQVNQSLESSLASGKWSIQQKEIAALEIALDSARQDLTAKKIGNVSKLRNLEIYQALGLPEGTQINDPAKLGLALGKLLGGSATNSAIIQKLRNLLSQ